VLTVMIGALAALDLLILVIRIRSVLSAGSLVVIPIEGPGLYAMWKLRHGFPLYEWPTQPYFSLTLYNALFYKVYAAVFTILRTPEPATPVVGRFVTLGFAVLGAAVQYVFFDAARPKGMVGDGLEGLIRDHYFGALILQSLLVPGSAGVQRRPLVGRHTIPQAGGEPLRVLLRAHPLKAV